MRGDSGEIQKGRMIQHPALLGFALRTQKGVVAVMTLLIRFRSARLRELCALAVDQNFGQKVTGSGHLGIICPTCGEMTIFSGTQKDCTPFKYQNQLSRLRNHGLRVNGKPTKGCVNADRKSA